MVDENVKSESTSDININPQTIGSTVVVNNGQWSGAHDIIIAGGTFVNQNGKESGFQKLQDVVSWAAIHNSAERAAAPNCHPGTRQGILQQLQAWIVTPNPEHKLIWLSGKVGVGKTAVMQELANTFSRALSDPKVVATFFFVRGRDKCDAGRYLFTTIAYQLALHIPGMRPIIDDIMLRQPSLPNQNMETQFHNLIANPLERLKSNISSHAPVVIIDGLDECGEDKDQESTINIISAALVGGLPLRFLISSRPEIQILDCFNQPLARDITLPLPLHGSYEDVESFLRDRFDGICARKARLMDDVVKPWPTDAAIKDLVKRSSGYFVYASVILQYVDAKHQLPTTQLDAIMDIRPSSLRTSAFSELDGLYTHILDTYPDQELLSRFLQLLVIYYEGHPETSFLCDLLDVQSGQLTVLIEALASLLDVHCWRRDISISPSHASFIDYLLDSSRSGRFYVNTLSAKTLIIRAGLSCVSKAIMENSRLSRKTCHYIENFLWRHLGECHDTFIREIFDTLERCRQFGSEQCTLQWTPGTISEANINGLHCALSFSKSIGGALKLRKETHSPETGSLLSGAEFYARQEMIEREYADLLDHFHRIIISSTDVQDMMSQIPELLGMDLAYVWSLAGLNGVTDGAMIDLLSKGSPLFQLRNSDMADQSLEVYIHSHVTAYLTDKKRAGEAYQDPSFLKPKIALCEKMIQLLFYDRKCRIGQNYLTGYWDELEEGLIDVFLTPWEEEKQKLIFPLAGRLLDTTYYSNDMDKEPCYDLYAVWCGCLAILKAVWEVKSEEIRFKSLADNISDRICSQILCARRTDKGSLLTFQYPLIKVEVASWNTLDNPGSHMASLEAMYSEMPQDPPFPQVNMADCGSIEGISDDFLLLSPLDFQFQWFISNKDAAGGLYMDTQTYFTQLVEVCIEVWSRRKGLHTMTWSERMKVKNSAAWVVYLPHLVATEEIYAFLEPIIPETLSIEVRDVADGFYRGTRLEADEYFQGVVFWLERQRNPVPKPEIVHRWRSAAKKFFESLKD